MANCLRCTCRNNATREEHDTRNWLLGSINYHDAREITVKTDFLDQEKNHHAILYSDAEDAHWDHNPTKYKIDTLRPDHNSGNKT